MHKKFEAIRVLPSRTCVTQAVSKKDRELPCPFLKIKKNALNVSIFGLNFLLKL